MFQLTESEVGRMVSQNAIPGKKHLGGHFPYAFTEHGVLMLANVLRSETAMQVSIRLIEVFVKMREMLFAHKDILIKLERIEKKMIKQEGKAKKHEENIKLIFEHLKQLLNPPQEPRPRIGFRRANEKE